MRALLFAALLALAGCNGCASCMGGHDVCCGPYADLPWLPS